MLRIYDILPLVIRLRDAEASGAGGVEPILKRITDRLLQDEYDTQAALIVGLKQLHDCLQVSSPYRPLLFQFLGQQVAEGWTEPLERFLLCEAIPWHKISGTVHGWTKTMVYRVAGAYDFHELFKKEAFEVGDYNPKSNAEFPLRAARIGVSPAGLFPYDWSADTIVCVPPYIPSPAPPGTTLPDYDAVLPVDYDVATSTVAPLFLANEKVVSTQRGDNNLFGKAIALNILPDDPYGQNGTDLFIGEPQWTNAFTGFFQQGRVSRYRQNQAKKWIYQEEIQCPTFDPVTKEPFTANTFAGSSVYAHKDYLWVSQQQNWAWVFKRRNDGSFVQVSHTDKTTETNIRRRAVMETHPDTGQIYAASIVRTPQFSLAEFFDTFTDTDSTALTSHVADTSQGWIQQSGVQPTVQNNQLLLSNATASGLSEIDADFSTDVIVSLDVTLNEAEFAGIAARSVFSANNSEYFRCVLQANGKIAIYWVAAGPNEIRLAEGNVVHDISLTWPLTLKMVGDTITLTSGIQPVSDTITVTNSNNLTETRFGLAYTHGSGLGVNGIVDNYKILDVGNATLDSVQLHQEIATQRGFAEAGLSIPVDGATSIHASGKFVAVGRPFVAAGGIPWVGQVDIFEVYEETPGVLRLRFVRSIHAIDEAEAIAGALLSGSTGSEFGLDVHMRGTEIAVASKWPTTNVATGSGTVHFSGACYLFNDTDVDGNYQYFQRLVRSYPSLFDPGKCDAESVFVYAATSVFIGDGYVAVGSPDDYWDSDFDNYRVDSTGTVTIYEGAYSYNGYLESQTLSPFGINGRQDAEFTPQDREMDFGRAVEGVDGSLAVGAFGDNFDEDGQNEVVDAGAVYTYEKSLSDITDPDVLGALVCLDFAILPVGVLDVTYSADDTTSVLVLNNQLPPQLVTPPPASFVGPFDLIGVRFRAWAPITTTVRVNNTLAVGELHDRAAQVNSLVVQEFEVWWSAADLGKPRWGDEDIDWSSFSVSFQTTDGNSVFITAAEFIVRQQLQGQQTSGDHTTVLTSDTLQHGSFWETRSEGASVEGVWQETTSEGVRVGIRSEPPPVPTIPIHGWLGFGNIVSGDSIPANSHIVSARIKALIRPTTNAAHHEEWVFNFATVFSVIHGRFRKHVDWNAYPESGDLTESAINWPIPIHPDTGDAGTDPVSELSTKTDDSPEIAAVIQEIVNNVRYGEGDNLFLLILRNTSPVGDIIEYDQHSIWYGDYCTLEIEWSDATSVDEGSDSCLQACECICQSFVEVGSTCKMNCQTVTETTACQGQCQVGTEGLFSLPPNVPSTFDVPPDQDGITQFQYELEGCFEVNECLGNTIKFTDAMDLFNAYFRNQRPIHVLPVYCLTVADLPEVASLAGDDFSVRVIANFIDDANTPQFDDLLIIPDCTQGCMVSCETFCEVGCEDNCQGIGACENSCQLNCESNCQTDCEVVCQQGCVIQCQNDGCQSFCQSSCEEFCQIACEDNCQGACEIAGCQLSCTAGCEDFCQFECQNSCEFDCQSPAEISCQTSCQEFCETCCQNACEGQGCQTTCEEVCQASCVSGCEESCETNCQTACEGGCQSVCEFNCQADCQGAGCEVSCEGGCQAGCQSTCEVTCEGASCQVGCESDGCQSCCECQCQSDGCEDGCTTGCTEGCQMGCESECQDAGGCETGCEMSCEGSSEACTDCCEVCCEEYTEYGCTLGSCESTCTAESCQSACQAESCQTGGCELGCQTGCEYECQVGVELLA